MTPVSESESFFSSDAAASDATGSLGGGGNKGTVNNCLHTGHGNVLPNTRFDARSWCP